MITSADGAASHGSVLWTPPKGIWKSSGKQQPNQLGKIDNWAEYI
jgi:hypothetical protein